MLVLSFHCSPRVSNRFILICSSIRATKPQSHKHCVAWFEVFKTLNIKCHPKFDRTSYMFPLKEQPAARMFRQPSNVPVSIPLSQQHPVTVSTQSQQQPKAVTNSPLRIKCSVVRGGLVRSNIVNYFI